MGVAVSCVENAVRDVDTECGDWVIVVGQSLIIGMLVVAGLVSCIGLECPRLASIYGGCTRGLLGCR